MTSQRVVIVGAAGYTGRELVHLLHAHPEAALVGLFGSADSAPRRFSDEFPRYRGSIDLDIQPLDMSELRALEPDAIFLATPHDVSAAIVGDLWNDLAAVGTRFVDLAGGFRLPDPALALEWYGLKNDPSGPAAHAVYSLVEHARDQLPSARLLSIPGCYPPAALMGLKPLADAGVLASGERVSVVGISGVSGAGRRAASTSTLFSEVTLRPYAIAGHRHMPEIASHLGANAPVVFTPHVGPWERGLVTTTHVSTSQQLTAKHIHGLFADAYPAERTPFVRLLTDEAGRGPLPSVLGVAHTNCCDLAWHLDHASNTLVVTAAIDNLLKGASGQAVQAWNVAIGLQETSRLTQSISEASAASDLLVHGGGAAADRELAAKGIHCSKIDGLRATPSEAMHVVADVLAGAVNAKLASALNAAWQSGQRQSVEHLFAVGLHLTDGGAAAVESLGRDDLGCVGTVVGGSGAHWNDLIACGRVPVIASIGSDENGQLLNVNADDAARGVAKAVNAPAVIYLTEAAGVLDHEGHTIAELDQAGVVEAMATGVVHTGMVPKLNAALDAAMHLDARVHIAGIDDLEPLLAGEARGTAIVRMASAGVRRPSACAHC